MFASYWLLPISYLLPPLGGQLERVFPQLIVDAVQWNVDWPLAAALSMVMVFAILGVLILISLFRNIGTWRMEAAANEK